MSDVDLFEINEAFSVQLVAVLRELGIDAQRSTSTAAPSRSDIRSARAARILTTLLYALEQARPETRHRRALSRRRQWRGGRRRAGLNNSQHGLSGKALQILPNPARSASARRKSCDACN